MRTIDESLPRRAAWLFLAAMIAPLACCSAKKPPLPLPVPTMNVVMRDYEFDHPSRASPGRVVVRVHNAGTLRHEMVVNRLPEEFTRTVKEFVASDDSVTFYTTVHLSARSPGGEGVFALDLVPGRYAFFCFVRDHDGVHHYKRGMASELRVG